MRTMFLGLVVWLVFGFIATLAVLCPAKAMPSTPPPRPEAERRRTLNAGALLNAIAQVETGNQAHRVGRKGERGRCQFMQATWYRYTTADFRVWASRDSQLSRWVETAHMGYLCRKLFSPGQTPEPLLLAAAWRYGPGAAVRNVRGDYAQRVANLYWEAVQ